MRALVVSGGGSKGAFAGGVAEFLLTEKNRDYDLYVGTSTGSLLIPLLASNNLEKARKVFTSIGQDDIFTKSPFKVEKGEGKEPKLHFNLLTISQMILKGSKTIGDSTALKNLITTTFEKKDFEYLHDKGKQVVVTVANLTRQQLEYKSSSEFEYEDFCDWVWASANVLPFMSLLVKNESEYGDGGFGNVIPIQEAIRRGAKEVDVIVLRPESRDIHFPPVKNVLQLMTRSYDFMFKQIMKDDLALGKLEAADHDVKLNFYFTPRLLTEQMLIFDKEQMLSWWCEGREVFKSTDPVEVRITTASKANGSWLL
ncbi:patatin-like phospholipase family protein [Ekhidna sp.]|uniref:patatin-like phospholipase family protein n=1 Tax=Ekhidna sp. TaxID=2608089 RepID=UPI003299FF86